MVIKKLKISDIKDFDKYCLSFPPLSELGKKLTDRFPNTPLISIDTNYTLITGHDIIEFYKSVSIDDFSAVVIEDRPENIFAAYNYIDTFGNPGVIEKLIFIKKAMSSFNLKQIRTECTIDIKISPEIIENIDLLISGKTAGLLKEGRVSLKNYMKLCKDFSIENRTTLIQLFTSYSFSHSNQQKILEIAEDLIFREKRLFNEIIDLSEKTSKAVLKELINLRYPALSEQTSKWDNTIKSLKLPDDIKLTHSDNFESRKVEVTITAQDLDKAVSIINKIKND